MVPPTKASVVLVVFSTTVVSKPESIVVVTEIMTAAVVVRGVVVDELLADGLIDRLAVRPLAVDEFTLLMLAVVRAGAGGAKTPVGPT